MSAEVMEIPAAARMAIHCILHSAAVRALGREFGGGLAVLHDSILDAMAQGGGVLPMSKGERSVCRVLVGCDPFMFGGSAFVFDGEGVRNA